MIWKRCQTEGMVLKWTFLSKSKIRGPYYKKESMYSNQHWFSSLGTQYRGTPQHLMTSWLVSSPPGHCCVPLRCIQQGDSRCGKVEPCTSLVWCMYVCYSMLLCYSGLLYSIHFFIRNYFTLAEKKGCLKNKKLFRLHSNTEETF